MRSILQIVWPILFLISSSCASTYKLSGDYQRYSEENKAIMRIGMDSVIMVAYHGVGEGYDILLGTYKIRRKHLILHLDCYQMRPAFPLATWKKINTTKHRLKISPTGELVHANYPKSYFRKNDRLEIAQQELLGFAPSWIKDYPYED
ncbi:MAG: hypothetical protein AAF135_11365 [Bacteroidota bacterium]